MIYFLINNNFHLIDAEKHLEDLKESKTALIKIPHKLTITSQHVFDREMEFPNLITNLKDHFNLLRIFSIHRKIRSELKNIQPNDILLFYTEYEFLTHYIINIFKKKKAKVILIEEGFPTYITFSSLPDTNLPLKKKFLNTYLKYILGYRYSKMVSLSDRPTSIIDDKQIDKILLYTKINIKRNIETGFLSTKQILFDSPREDTVLFLNEGLYGFYVSMEIYLDMIDDILKKLSSHFEHIYFKFHPREKDKDKILTETIIKKYPKTKIITDNTPVELMINEIGAKYITSFSSQTLLYLSNSNCFLLYIFHLYPELMKHKGYMSIKNMLDQMNYNFMNDWSEIKKTNIGFYQDPNFITKTIKTHLDID